MSFLYLDEKTKEVKITNEGLTLPEVKELLKQDNTQGRKKFQRALIYIFYAYGNEGIFRNKLPEERKRITCNTYLNAVDPSRYEENPYVIRVIERYISLSYTPTEQLYERLKHDIQDMLKKISAIPFEKEITVEINQDVEIEYEHDGQTFKNTIPVSQKVKTTYDNSKEKLEAIATSEKLFIQEDRLKKRIEKEAIESGRRKFDGQ